MAGGAKDEEEENTGWSMRWKKAGEEKRSATAGETETGVWDSREEEELKKKGREG